MHLCTGGALCESRNLICCLTGNFTELAVIQRRFSFWEREEKLSRGLLYSTGPPKQLLTEGSRPPPKRRRRVETAAREVGEKI